jgi:hypothetical protein
MNEAVYCKKCNKKYYDHDVRSCPNPDWHDVESEPTLQLAPEPTVGVTLAEVKAGKPYRLTFYKDAKEIGYLDLDSKTDFQGDATESAKVFLKIVQMLWEQQQTNKIQ